MGPREYLGTAAPERLRELFRLRSEISAAQLALAGAAWAAFRSPDPTAVAALAGGDTSALPFLGAALLRHLEELPSAENGLSRSEEQALEAFARGPLSLAEAFPAAHRDREDPIFLGDSVFAAYLERLSAGPEPLLLREGGGPVIALRWEEDTAGSWRERAVLSQAGRAVLEGRRDWVEMGGVDRWWGGVPLRRGAPDWRWERGAGRIVRRGA